MEKLIISFTSYPKRIHCVKFVLHSLTNQSVKRELYHIVLVLAIPQFPNKERDLPQDLVECVIENNVEIIWYPRDILSHKKIIPALTKYPHNPILICDDDLTRDYDWIETFVNDHLKYPKDIIVGQVKFKLDWKLLQTGIPRYCNNIANMVLMTERPQNGYGGTLYPVGTFTDKRFFDENLFMQLSPTSDEMWQYCFCIMDDRTLRLASKFYDYSKMYILDSQEIALWKINMDKRNAMYNTLFKYFPKFRKKMIKRVIFELLSLRYVRMRAIAKVAHVLCGKCRSM